MPKKVISYKLEKDGTIPHYVEDGGYLPKEPNDTPNMICMGISKNGFNISHAEAEFVDEASAIAYVKTYLSDSTTTDPITGEEKVFLVSDAVQELFAKLA